MSQSAEYLQRKMRMAGELKSVVKNLKAIAATRMGPLENAVSSLADYYRTVELGLVACMLRVAPNSPTSATRRNLEKRIGLVVFGSDQGLVGTFNDHLPPVVLKSLEETEGQRILWPVGERLYAKLLETSLATLPSVSIERPDNVPDTVEGITPLISRVLGKISERRETGLMDSVLLVYNRPSSGSGYEAVCRRLMPLDDQWLRDLKATPWPTKLLPQVRRDKEETFAALIREYLFVSVFRACAESMTSENAARLASMQGAEDNINHILEGLQTEYNLTRQNAIDSELFEVVSGFEAMQSLV